MIRDRYIVVLSFLFTVAFFIEYTPLYRRVHIPFDLEGFHYPLADYAFQSIRQGRFSQWDPTIYCGLSFAGNTQAALFYPPSWLMFALSWGRPRLSYQALEDLLLAHVWLAFLLCYLWLRGERGLHPLAAALGSAAFAFSGYMLLQLQHFGMVAGYAWMPLGFSAIDAAGRQRRMRPLWKLAAASALCFLAGYPPTWVVFAVCMLAYAVGRRSALRCALLVALALAASLCLAAVQLIPAWETAQLKVPELRYNRASGVTDTALFLSYFVPNYWDFGLDVPVHTNPGREYLYLGAPAFAGLALLVRRRHLSGAAPLIAVLLVSLLFLTNPLAAPASVIERSSLLAQIFSDWCFLAGLTASAAGLAALGLDSALTQKRMPLPRWLAAAVVGLSLAWCIRLVVGWISGGRFAAGWLSGIDALAAAILFASLIFVYPGSSGRARTAVAAAALILPAADYKAFGTSKRFNAASGSVSANYLDHPFPYLNASVYETLRRNPEYRVALDLTAPLPGNLRHVGLATPQGFDPLLPSQYKALIDRIARFRTNREFDLNPDDEAALRLLGVRYFISSEGGPLYSRLSSSLRFRLLQPADGYYKVFEFADPQPAFGWEEQGGGRSAELNLWLPERRVFLLRSGSGGRFRLTEQFFPGWMATVDGMTTRIERCHQAFQCIDVAPGEHAVEFRYRSRLFAVFSP